MEPTGNKISENHWQRIMERGSVTHSTAKELFTQGLEYFKWCDENPVQESIPIRTGKRAGQVDYFNKPRPYTIKGLCLHLNVLQDYLEDVRKTKVKESDYYIAVSKLLYIIHVQNSELAITGTYNPAFVMRMLAMDKDEIQVSAIKVEMVQGLPPLSESENEVLEKLEAEKSLFKTEE